MQNFLNRYVQSGLAEGMTYRQVVQAIVASALFIAISAAIIYGSAFIYTMVVM